MVELHVFGIQGKITAYRRLIERHLGYKIKIKLLRKIHKSKCDIVPDLDYDSAEKLAESIKEECGAELAFVFDEDAADLIGPKKTL
jgi:hypothetical protein